MTPHIEAQKEDIAKIVLMPGDPLRAKYIAENFLEDYKLVNKVRNMYAYTGTYKGKRITIFASGMGIPSMGIYSYELFKFYDVDTIIRIGSAGSYDENLAIYDLVLVNGSFSESSYDDIILNKNSKLVYGNNEVNEIINNKAKELNIEIRKENVRCAEVFYEDYKNTDYEKYNCKAVEMETFSLFSNANFLNKKASAILTISDNLITKTQTTSEEREKSFNDMIILALESSLEL